MRAPENKDSEDPFQRETLWNRLKRSTFFLVAVAIHLIVLILFGHHVFFEPHRKASLNTTSLFAPPAPKEAAKPPAPPEEKQIEVKPPHPKEDTKEILSNNKLSTSFNVEPPPLSPTVTGPGGGSPGGVAGGSGDGGAVGISDVHYGDDAKIVRIVYCVDISRSMISGERAFKVIEQELMKQLHRLNESTNMFNIVTFAKVESLYKKDSVAASGAETGNALLWFHKLSPESFRADNWKKDQLDDVVDFHLGSHPQLALEKAFQENPAVIVLLSDGNPTDISRETVMDKIKALQAKAGRQVVINTVLFETASENEENHRARSFMQMVARDTGGTFYSVKHPKKNE